MPRRRNDPENTQGGGEAKEPRINRGEQHSKTASPSSSYHGDDSPQVIQPTISTCEEDFKDQPPVWAKVRKEQLRGYAILHTLTPRNLGPHRPM